jgi:hypothetical protein
VTHQVKDVSSMRHHRCSTIERPSLAAHDRVT